MAVVIEIENEQDYLAAVANAGDKLVVVEFYATWTVPSVVISEELEVIRHEFPEIVHVRLNFDKNAALFNKYEVNIMPCIKLLKNGEELGEIMGAYADRIRGMIENSLL